MFANETVSSHNTALRPIFENQPPQSISNDVANHQPAAPELDEDFQTQQNNGFNPVWQFGGVARSLYVNDQRIEFTGQEATFAVEAQLIASASVQRDQWCYSLFSETYLTQPFDDNILVDSDVRSSFAGNFDDHPLEISQLYLSASRGIWTVDFGRFVTPFGRYYSPILTNARNDVPFIRSESILFRETGIRIACRPGIFNIELAGTNGSEGKDTNSSKAGMGRFAIETDQYAIGTSFKWQDGIGSESQKEFNNHAGLDAMYRTGCWTLAGEVIYDQYGLRRPGVALDQITWGRSIYNRQLNNGLLNPITGVGWYVQLIYQDPTWSNTIGFGEFHPETIGDPIQDVVTHRILAKSIYRLTPNLGCFIHSTFENSLPMAQAGKPRVGVFLIGGFQFEF